MEKEEDKEEGILEQMLERLKAIGQNVQRIMYRCGFYSTGVEREDDAWSPEDLYENGKY